MCFQSILGYFKSHMELTLKIKKNKQLRDFWRMAPSYPLPMLLGSLDSDACANFPQPWCGSTMPFLKSSWFCSVGSPIFACFQQTRPQKWSQDVQERKVKLLAVCFQLEIDGNHLNAKMSYLSVRICGNLSKNDLGKGIDRRKVQNPLFPPGNCNWSSSDKYPLLANSLVWCFFTNSTASKVGKPTYFHETVRCSKRQTWLKSTT